MGRLEVRERGLLQVTELGHSGARVQIQRLLNSDLGSCQADP